MSMRKFSILGPMLLAVFAFAAVTAMSATAAPVFLLAEWLWNGNPVTTALLVETSGTLTLEDGKVPLVGKVAISCKGLLDGFAEAVSLSLITELLTEGGAAVSKTALVEPALECTNIVNCAGPVLVWAIHLPWLTELELLEDANGSIYVVLILEGGAGKPGWYVECMGSFAEDTCEAHGGEGVFEVMNEATTTLGLFSEAIAERAEVKLADCTKGGAESSTVIGEDLMEDPEGGSITASSI